MTWLSVAKAAFAQKAKDSAKGGSSHKILTTIKQERRAKQKVAGKRAEYPKSGLVRKHEADIGIPLS